MTRCITELTSLFLLSAPAFIKKIPRFQVPTNTARLVLESEKELVTDPEGLKKTIQNLRGKKTLQKSARVAEAITQTNALLRERRFEDAIKTIEVAANQLGDNPDLVMMSGRCYFIKARQSKDSSANTAARKLFKKAYDLGQRKGYLFECWFQSELEADHPSGACEVAELAIKYKTEPKSEWRLHRADSLHKLALRHIQSNNPQEALIELEKCVKDIALTLTEGCESRFERETLRTTLNRINDDRIELVCRTAQDFSEWETAVETIVAVVDSGDERPSNAYAVVDAFAKMVRSISVQNIKEETRPRRAVKVTKEEAHPRKHHLAAVYNRRREVIYVLRRTRFLKAIERQNLEQRIKAALLPFEAGLSKEAVA